MREDGLDLSRHESGSAQAQDFGHYDEVYALTRSHLAALRGLVPPKFADRLHLLDPDGRDVPDPYGGTRAEYRRTADAIAGMVAARLDGWA
jgi:protein-tyrosine-phosphatase